MNISFINSPYPSVLHFHGDNRFQLSKTLQLIKATQIVSAPPKNLAILSCWTDDNECILLEQCQQNNIPLINIVPEDYDRSQSWYMPNKINFVLDKLQSIDNDIVLFVDGYDVLFTNLSDIVSRFKNQKYRILYNASCNNYPDVIIDRIYDQTHMGTYRYFNAGCCIGYREDLIKFYNEALHYIDLPNSIGSEQFVMRFAYSKYSSDPYQNFIGIDYQGNIFQSMGYKNISYNQELDTLFISNTYNKEKSTILVVTHNKLDQLKFDKNKYSNDYRYINFSYDDYQLDTLADLINILYIEKVFTISLNKLNTFGFSTGNFKCSTVI